MLLRTCCSDRTHAAVYGVWCIRRHPGAHPIDAITEETGHMTLRFLTLTLVVTPPAEVEGWNP